MTYILDMWLGCSLIKQNEYTAVKRDYNAFVADTRKDLSVKVLRSIILPSLRSLCKQKKNVWTLWLCSKKHSAQNDLPTNELIDLGAKYKAEIKELADELVEKKV